MTATPDADPAEPTVAAEHDADQRPGDRLPPRPHGPADVPESVQLRPIDDTPLPEPPEPVSVRDVAGLFAPNLDARTEWHTSLARAKTIRADYDHLLPLGTDDQTQTASLIVDLLLLAETRGQAPTNVLAQVYDYLDDHRARFTKEGE